jgi:hypothetical protein
VDGSLKVEPETPNKDAIAIWDALYKNVRDPETGDVVPSPYLRNGQKGSGQIKGAVNDFFQIFGPFSHTTGGYIKITGTAYYIQCKETLDSLSSYGFKYKGAAGAGSLKSVQQNWLNVNKSVAAAFYDRLRSMYTSKPLYRQIKTAWVASGKTTYTPLSPLEIAFLKGFGYDVVLPNE